MGAKFVIGYLEGNLNWKSHNKIIIDVNGTGYLVEVSDLYDCPEIGDSINIFIYTYVREDTLDLYGFETMAERELFETLMSVSRVGPKAAMNILSTLTYDEFVNAILSEKIAVLKEVSGIGPKTAQRLILELKSKIDDLAQKAQINPTNNVRDDELYEALNNLGYSNKEIGQAISSVDINPETELQDKIKQILSYLGKESF